MTFQNEEMKMYRNFKKISLFQISIVRERFMQSVNTFPAQEPGVDPTGDNQYRAMGW